MKMKNWIAVSLLGSIVLASLITWTSLVFGLVSPVRGDPDPNIDALLLFIVSAFIVYRFLLYLGYRARSRR